MKKLFAVAAAVLAGTVLFGFAGCASGGERAGLGGGLGGGAGVQAEAGAKSAYALGAVTTAGLLSASAAASAAASTSAAGTEGTPSAATEEFRAYFEMLDSFLDEGALTTEVTENTDTSYPFSTKLTVRGMDMGGGEMSYIMYYTETQTHSFEGDRERGEYVSGVAYTLEGVLEMGGVAYEMRGYRASVTEREDGEEERSESLWIMASDPEDAARRVRMDVESEHEQEGSGSETEREFVYRVYTASGLAEQTSISFETEDGGRGSETEYEISILRGGERSRFEVEREERMNGNATIGVNYYTPEGQGRFAVTRTADGAYVYRADEGYRGGGFEDFDD